MPFNQSWTTAVFMTENGKRKTENEGTVSRCSRFPFPVSRFPASQCGGVHLERLLRGLVPVEVERSLAAELAKVLPDLRVGRQHDDPAGDGVHVHRIDQIGVAARDLLQRRGGGS